MESGRMTILADTAESRPTVDVLSTEEMDRLNLEQALIDFEIANARVVDLTGRVTALTSEVLKLRSELGMVKLRVGQAEAEAAAAANHLAEIRSSLAFRVSRALGDARAKAMRR